VEIVSDVKAKIKIGKSVFVSFSQNFCYEIDTPQNLFFCFPNAVWALANGGFRIVSDTLV